MPTRGEMASRILTIISWLVGILVVVILGLTVGTALDRGAVIALASIEGSLDRTVYHPGDIISGDWDVRALRPCNGVAERWVTVERSGAHPWVYSLSPAPVRLSDFVGDLPNEISYPVTTFPLPSDTPVGEGRYHHVDHFVCDRPGQWLFPIDVAYPVLRFRIEPAQSSTSPLPPNTDGG